jgi:hypothetical protein
MRSDTSRQQVYADLSKKSTEELVAILCKNDQVQRNSQAFDVIRELLIERGADIPDQNEATRENFAKGAKNDDLEEQSSFYNPRQVTRLCKLINWVIIAAPILLYMQELIRLPGYIELVRSFLPDFFIRDLLAWVFALIYTNVIVAIGFLFIFFPLKGLATVLQILVDIELRTRSSKPTFSAAE